MHSRGRGFNSRHLHIIELKERVDTINLSRTGAKSYKRKTALFFDNTKVTTTIDPSNERTGKTVSFFWSSYKRSM